MSRTDQLKKLRDLDPRTLQSARRDIQARQASEDPASTLRYLMRVEKRCQDLSISKTPTRMAKSDPLNDLLKPEGQRNKSGLRDDAVEVLASLDAMLDEIERVDRSLGGRDAMPPIAKAHRKTLFEPGKNWTTQDVAAYAENGRKVLNLLKAKKQLTEDDRARTESIVANLPVADNPRTHPQAASIFDRCENVGLPTVVVLEAQSLPDRASVDEAFAKLSDLFDQVEAIDRWAREAGKADRDLAEGKRKCFSDEGWNSDSVDTYRAYVAP